MKPSYNDWAIEKRNEKLNLGGHLGDQTIQLLKNFLAHAEMKPQSTLTLADGFDSMSRRTFAETNAALPIYVTQPHNKALRNTNSN